MNTILRLFNKTFARVPYIKEQVGKVNKKVLKDEVLDIYQLGSRALIQSRAHDW